MMVHDRHISVYDQDSALILVMATDVRGIRILISGICLLILPVPNSVPRCFRDWYMLAHTALLCSQLHPPGPPECGTFVAPERHARSSTNDLFSQVALAPFPPPPPLRGRGFRDSRRGGERRRRVGGVGVGVTSDGFNFAAAGVTFTVGGGVGADALELALERR
jgi:hypothetical protein